MKGYQPMVKINLPSGIEICADTPAEAVELLAQLDGSAPETQEAAPAEESPTAPPNIIACFTRDEILGNPILSAGGVPVGILFDSKHGGWIPYYAKVNLAKKSINYFPQDDKILLPTSMVAELWDNASTEEEIAAAGKRIFIALASF